MEYAYNDDSSFIFNRDDFHLDGDVCSRISDFEINIINASAVKVRYDSFLDEVEQRKREVPARPHRGLECADRRRRRGDRDGVRVRRRRRGAQARLIPSASVPTAPCPRIAGRRRGTEVLPEVVLHT